MCIPFPSGIPLNPIMLGISPLGKVILSYFPNKISYLPELFSSLNKKRGSPAVRLTVARNCDTESNVPGLKASFCPL